MTGWVASRSDFPFCSGMPDYAEEDRLAAAGARVIAGIDEVGRGPLAGPVTAAAVVLDPTRMPRGLDDSKRLSVAAKERLFDEIMASARVSVAHASVEEIDTLNILYASHLAMERALSGLGPVCHALVDGNMIPKGLGCPATALVKGDARSLSIAPPIEGLP